MFTEEHTAGRIGKMGSLRITIAPICIFLHIEVMMVFSFVLSLSASIL